MANSPSPPRHSGAQLSGRMGLTLALTVLLTLGPVGAVGMAALSQGLREEARDRAGAVLLTLSAPTALTLADYAMDRLDSYLAEAARPTAQDVMVRVLVVLNTEGQIVAASTAALQPPAVAGLSATDSSEFLTRAASSRYPIWQRFEPTDDHALLLVSMPAVSGLRWGTLVGVFDLFPIEQRIRTSQIWVTFALLTLALLVGATSYAAFRRIMVTPLERLSAAAAALQAGKRHVRLDWKRNDELGMVADSFDHMAGEIERYTESLEQKVAERSAEVEAKNAALQAVNQQLQKANAELERLAHVDPLTLVPNRRSFDQAFERGVGQDAGPWTILMCDIDHFKQVNDRFGHRVGDVVLREVAAILREGVRGGDVLARYGGEEFVAILRGTDLVRAREVAERLRRDVDQHDFAAAVGVAVGHLSISIGMWEGGDPDVAREVVLERADQALYAAKKAGRNRVSAWTPAIAAAALRGPATVRMGKPGRGPTPSSTEKDKSS